MKKSKNVPPPSPTLVRFVKGQGNGKKPTRGEKAAFFQGQNVTSP